LIKTTTINTPLNYITTLGEIKDRYPIGWTQTLVLQPAQTGMVPLSKRKLDFLGETVPCQGAWFGCLYRGLYFSSHLPPQLNIPEQYKNSIVVHAILKHIP
jgi:hypothetical protein